MHRGRARPLPDASPRSSTAASGPPRGDSDWGCVRVSGHRHSAGGPAGAPRWRSKVAPHSTISGASKGARSTDPPPSSIARGTSVASRSSGRHSLGSAARPPSCAAGPASRACRADSHLRTLDIAPRWSPTPPRAARTPSRRFGACDHNVCTSVARARSRPRDQRQSPWNRRWDTRPGCDGTVTTLGSRPHRSVPAQRHVRPLTWIGASHVAVVIAELWSACATRALVAGGSLLG